MSDSVACGAADREFECDEGLVVKYGMCMKYATGDSASPVPVPAADAAIVNVMEEDDVRVPSCCQCNG